MSSKWSGNRSGNRLQHEGNSCLKSGVSNRTRTKTMDGLHGQESGQKYLDRWVLDYNHFKDHEALDSEVPAKVAKVGVVLDEWTDVVREVDKFKAAYSAIKSQMKAEARATPTATRRQQNRGKHGRGRLV